MEYFCNSENNLVKLILEKSSLIIVRSKALVIFLSSMDPEDLKASTGVEKINDSLMLLP